MGIYIKPNNKNEAIVRERESNRKVTIIKADTGTFDGTDYGLIHEIQENKKPTEIFSSSIKECEVSLAI